MIGSKVLREKEIGVDGGDGTAERLAALEQDLARERQARQALVESSVRLNSTLNLPELLETIMTTSADLLGAEASSLLLWNEETNDLSFAVATGASSESVRDLRVPAGQGVAGWVLQHGEPVLIADVAQDERFYESIDQSSGFVTRSMLAVPLLIRGQVIGVVEVINKRDPAGFSARDQEIASAFAAQAAVAIDNARLYRQLADAVVESRLSYRL